MYGAAASNGANEIVLVGGSPDMVISNRYSDVLRARFGTGTLRLPSELPAVLFASSTWRAEYAGTVSMLHGVRLARGGKCELRVMEGDLSLAINSTSLLHNVAAGPNGAPSTAQLPCKEGFNALDLSPFNLQISAGQYVVMAFSDGAVPVLVQVDNKENMRTHAVWTAEAHPKSTAPSIPHAFTLLPRSLLLSMRFSVRASLTPASLRASSFWTYDFAPPATAPGVVDFRYNSPDSSASAGGAQWFPHTLSGRTSLGAARWAGAGFFNSTSFTPFMPTGLNIGLQSMRSQNVIQPQRMVPPFANSPLQMVGLVFWVRLFENVNKARGVSDGGDGSTPLLYMSAADGTSVLRVFTRRPTPFSRLIAAEITHASGTNVCTTPLNNMPLHDWTQVYVILTTTSVIRMYLNGVLQGSTECAFFAPLVPRSVALIGQGLSASDGGFQGSLSDVSMHYRWTTEEIAFAAPAYPVSAPSALTLVKLPQPSPQWRRKSAAVGFRNQLYLYGGVDNTNTKIRYLYSVDFTAETCALARGNGAAGSGSLRPTLEFGVPQATTQLLRNAPLQRSMDIRQRDLSFSLWAKLDTTDFTEPLGLFAFGAPTNINAAANTLYVAPGGYLTWLSRESGSPAMASIALPAADLLGKWFHLSGSMRSSAGATGASLALYMNGVQLATSPAGSPTEFLDGDGMTACASKPPLGAWEADGSLSGAAAFVRGQLLTGLLHRCACELCVKQMDEKACFAHTSHYCFCVPFLCCRRRQHSQSVTHADPGFVLQCCPCTCAVRRLLTPLFSFCLPDFLGLFSSVPVPGFSHSRRQRRSYYLPVAPSQFSEWWFAPICRDVGQHVRPRSKLWLGFR
jgi:hypothetical protein